MKMTKSARNAIKDNPYLGDAPKKHAGKIFLNEPYIKECTNGNVRLCCDMQIDSEKVTAYFEVDKAWAKYFVTEISDPFVLATVELGMRKSYDIEFTTPMSEQLYYQLVTYLIPIYARNLEIFNNIDLIGPTTNQEISSEKKVATGFSAGIDSFYTVLKHLKSKENSNMQLTHLMIAVNGSAVTGNTEKIDQEWYENTLNKLKPYADALKLQLVGVSGNIDLLYVNARCFNGDIVVTSSFVYALQKLFGTYYWGSAYPAEIFSFIEGDGGSFENISVQYVTTRAIHFYHSGSEINRVGKVRYIADNAIAQKGLTVCGDVSGKNCGRPQCPKCMRTMAELKAVGKLQYFSEAFPVDDYEKHFASRLAMEMAIDHAPFTVDILNEMKRNNVTVPVSYYFWRPVNKIYAWFWTHAKESTLIRKIYYKFDLDEKLGGKKQNDEERARRLRGEGKQ